VDAGTHGPDTHAGHRTPDIRTLRRPYRTPDSGRVMLDARTRHRTLTEDTDTLTKARPGSAPPGHGA